MRGNIEHILITSQNQEGIKKEKIIKENKPFKNAKGRFLKTCLKNLMLFKSV